MRIHHKKERWIALFWFVFIGGMAYLLSSFLDRVGPPPGFATLFLTSVYALLIALANALVGFFYGYRVLTDCRAGFRKDFKKLLLIIVVSLLITGLLRVLFLTLPHPFMNCRFEAGHFLCEGLVDSGDSFLNFFSMLMDMPMVFFSMLLFGVIYFIGGGIWPMLFTQTVVVLSLYFSRRFFIRTNFQ